MLEMKPDDFGFLKDTSAGPARKVAYDGSYRCTAHTGYRVDDAFQPLTLRDRVFGPSLSMGFDHRVALRSARLSQTSCDGVRYGVV